jgi:predicted nucleic acid-binding protein
MAPKFFWDTHGFFALLNSEDPAHAAARAVQTRCLAQRIASFTCDWIIGETATLLVMRKKPHLVPEFFRATDGARALQVVRAEDTDYDAAKALMQRSLAHGYSFVDCVAMTVAKRLEISAIVTGDRHFKTAGFEVLL